MDKSGPDWPVLIFIAIVVGVGCFGAGMITGSTMSQSRPSARTVTASATAGQPSPNPSATNGYPQCSFADFPVYPGSDNYHVSPPMQNAWYVDQPPSQVASYFARGAYQHAWAFVAGGNATPAPGMYPTAYQFRFTRAPACRGELTVSPYTRDRATVYQAIPDAP